MNNAQVMPYGVRAAASATGHALSRDTEIVAQERTDLHFYAEDGTQLYTVALNAGELYPMKKAPSSVKWVVFSVHASPTGNMLRATRSQSHVVL